MNLFYFWLNLFESILLISSYILIITSALMSSYVLFRLILIMHELLFGLFDIYLYVALPVIIIVAFLIYNLFFNCKYIFICKRNASSNSSEYKKLLERSSLNISNLKVEVDNNELFDIFKITSRYNNSEKITQLFEFTYTKYYDGIRQIHSTRLKHLVLILILIISIVVPALLITFPVNKEHSSRTIIEYNRFEKNNYE